MRALVLAVVVSALSVAACNRGADIEKMANDALDRSALADKVDANYDKSQNVVHLTGTVASADERTKADDAVRASIGNRAKVANEVVIEGLNEKTADNFDDAIEERFSALWKDTPDLKDFDVALDANNGVATLEGKVATDAEKTKAESLVRTIPGVKEVVNSITVSPDARRTVRR
jgi:osmotically-inducible protein OsmY